MAQGIFHGMCLCSASFFPPAPAPAPAFGWQDPFDVGRTLEGGAMALRSFSASIAYGLKGFKLILSLCLEVTSAPCVPLAALQLEEELEHAK